MAFKMKGISPLNTSGHGGEEGHTHPSSPDLPSGGLVRSRGGGPRPKVKRKKRKKDFKFTKVGKFFRGITGGGGSRGGATTKLGCGPGSCPS